MCTECRLEGLDVLFPLASVLAEEVLLRGGKDDLSALVRDGYVDWVVIHAVFDDFSVRQDAQNRVTPGVELLLSPVSVRAVGHCHLHLGLRRCLVRFVRENDCRWAPVSWKGTCKRVSAALQSVVNVCPPCDAGAGTRPFGLLSGSHTPPSTFI